MTWGRVAKSGRVATSGRVAKSGRVAVSNRAAIDPLTISGIQLVMDANDTIYQTDVSTLVDKSTGGHSITQASAPLRATLVASQINGRAILRFAANTTTYTTAFSLPQPVTVLRVWKQTTFSGAGSGDIPYDGGTNASQFVICSSSAGQAWRINAAVNFGDNSRRAENYYDYEITIFNGASSLSRVGGKYVVTGNFGATAAAGVTVGSLQDGTRGIAQDLAYFAVVGAALNTTTQVPGVEQFFRQTFALP